MSYAKQNYKSGEVLTAAQLNAMDDQIAANETASADAARAAAAKYAKPEAGIPKTDLSSDVQTSLGKADTALQEHQSLADYRKATEQAVIDWSQAARLKLIECLRRAAYTDVQGPTLIAELAALLSVDGSETPVTMHTITKALTNASISNDAATIAEGSSYSAIVSPTAGYDWPTVSVSMGGTDITASAYNAITGTVSISNVTGDIIITASAVETTGLLSRYGREDTEIVLYRAKSVYTNNSSGTTIGTSRSANNRQVLGAVGGEGFYTDDTSTTYYPIAIPDGATAVSIYTDFAGSIGVMTWEYSDGTGYIKKSDPGWQATVRSMELPSNATHISIACNNNDTAVVNLLCLFE